MKSSNFAVVGLFIAIAACTADAPRDSGGVRMHLSEPKIISAINATTNLPKMYNTNEIVVKRIIRDNGATTWEKYYHKGRLVAETEKVNGGKTYNDHTIVRLNNEAVFRRNNGIPETTLLERPSETRVYGFYTVDGRQCEAGIGKAIGSPTTRGRPNSVLYTYSCAGLHKDYRGYMQKIVREFDIMRSADTATIVNRIQP